jgi:cytochrome c peroxidase
MKLLIAVSFILSIFFLGSCIDRDNEKTAATPLTIILPERFPPMEIPDNNPLTQEGVELGRMLFYDPILDKDNSRSCATCHQQKYAFSSPDHEKHGLKTGIMPHFNFAWNNAFLWDGKVEGTLEDIMHFEVKEFFKTDLDKLNKHPQYPGLFRKAFGVNSIDHQEIAKALAQFQRTLISGNSKFDKFLRDEVLLSEQEYRGYYHFFAESGDCFHCHGTILFKDGLFHNNGLDHTFDESNFGRFHITQNPNDIGKFKTPSLRNIELTAPYMHDNRYKTLEEVLDFYSGHVNFTQYTDPLMNHEGGIMLTEDEKKDIIAFLKTLTDSSFITDPKFSNPFNEN